MLALGMSLPGLRSRAEAISHLPALGLLTLAGATPAHWSCSYHEAERCDESLVDRVLSTRPTLVAVSALTASVEEAYRFCSCIRRAGVSVVLGGLHVTACSTEARQHADRVVVGEGEPVWHELLADVEAGTPKPVYRAETPFALEHSPIPRWSLLGETPRPRLTLQTQRGCPFACDFCGASRLLGPYREKPLTNLSAELDAIRHLDAHATIELADDNTFAGSRDPHHLFETLAASDVRYFTEADWRIGTRPDLLNELSASGCVAVLVGIESLVFRHGGMGAKAAPLSRVLEAVCAIQDSGVAVMGCLIVGADGETRASVDRLGDFLLSSPFADIQLTIQTPFPGTALYHRMQRTGRLLPHRGWSYYTLFDVTYQPDGMDADGLQNCFHDLIIRVFSDNAVRRRDTIRHGIWRRHARLRTCEYELCSSS